MSRQDKLPLALGCRLPSWFLKAVGARKLHTAMKYSFALVHRQIALLGFCIQVLRRLAHP